MARKLSGRWNIPQNATPENRVCFCFNLPDDPEYFGIVWGMLDLLALPSSWEQSGAASPADIARYWLGVNADNRACFEEVLGMANRGCGCDDTPAITRYNPQGIQEVSNDGGATWSEAGSDPRVSGTIAPPPMWFITGGDNACNGAITLRINMRAMNDQIFGVGTEVGLPAVLETLALIICTFTWVACAVAQLIAGVATILLQIGAAAIQAALTEAIYDQFECIVFCHIGADASFNQAQWLAVKDDIASQMSGDAEFWLWNMVNIAGPVGLTNMARTSIAVSGNCDDCGCEPCSASGIWYVVDDNPLTYAKAQEVAPNVVRLHSYVPFSTPNRDIISWRFGSPSEPDTCCRTLGYQLIDGVNPDAQEAHEITCSGADAPHLWPWLGVEVCGFAGYITSTNIAPFSIDLVLDPDTGCV